MRTFCLILILVVETCVNAQNIDRFMVVGDAHLYSPSPDVSQTILYEITLAAIEEQVDFIFFPGDLIVRGFSSPSEEDSVLKDWRFVLDTLHQHNISVFACRGNNDVSSRESWDSLFSGAYLLPQNGPENEKNITYAIEYDNLLFIAMDEYTISHQINQVWLDEILANADREHIFIAGHEPAFKLFNQNCLGAFPIERNQFWESLTNAGVKIYFCGHDHFYDHTIIDDGDGNPHNDVHQVIVGTGGTSFFHDLEYNGDNGRWNPLRLFHEENNGYVLVEIDDSVVQMTWKHRVEPGVYDDGGDSFTFSSSVTGLEVIELHDFIIRIAPNPFHAKTVIGYRLKKDSEVELSVYNYLGVKAATLVKKRQSSGSYEVEWHAEGIKPGIYICKLNVSGYEKALKLIVSH